MMRGLWLVIMLFLFSASAAALPSFSAKAGRPRASARRPAKGIFSMPGMLQAAPTKVPRPASIMPGETAPTAWLSSSRSAAASAAKAAVTASAPSSTGVGRLWRARTRPSPSTRAAKMLVPPRSMPMTLLN